MAEDAVKLEPGQVVKLKPGGFIRGAVWSAEWEVLGKAGDRVVAVPRHIGEPKPAVETLFALDPAQCEVVTDG